MNQNLKRSIITFSLLVVGTTTAGAKDILSDDQRWEYENSSPRGSLIYYLHEHPEGKHVEEARAKLKTQNSTLPLARIAASNAECEAALDRQAKSALDSSTRHEEASKYDFELPNGYFLKNSTITFVPKGMSVETAPIEQHVTLNLLAGRDGGCMLGIRWSQSGRGLPASCTCEPLQAGYKFENPYAKGPLNDYSKMSAVVDACKRDGVNHAKLVDDYMSIFTARYQFRAQKIRARLTEGKSLFPSEKTELAQLESAIPELQKKTVQADAYEAEKKRFASSSPAERREFCKTGFPEKVQDMVKRMSFIN
jgi:hypothetical protein